MCWVTQHQCRGRQMCKIFIYSPSITHICLLQKMTGLAWTYLFMVSFQLISMSSYAKNKLQMCWVTQHQRRSRQMWKIFTNSPSSTHFCLLQKMTSLAWTINSWSCFQLIRMSSYDKNKLQMYWVIQQQCRSRQMWKIFTNSPSKHSLFDCYKKWLVLPEQSIHGKHSTH